MNNNLNTKSSASQNVMILQYLQEGNAITALEALEMFGCLRLPSRIHDLKRRGINIISKTVKLANGKHVSQYSIAE